jgi:hypothetical protein
VILTASILRIYVTCHGTNVKLPDDDTEMSKHVGVYIIQRDTVAIYTVVILTCSFGCNKDNKNARYLHYNNRQILFVHPV